MMDKRTLDRKAEAAGYLIQSTNKEDRLLGISLMFEVDTHTLSEESWRKKMEIMAAATKRPPNL